MQPKTYLLYRLCWQLVSLGKSPEYFVDVAVGETASDAQLLFEIEKRKEIDAERKRAGANGRKPRISVLRVEPLDAWLRISRNGRHWNIEEESVNLATLAREI